MNDSQLRVLHNAIFEVQTWKPGRSPFALENDFYQLMLSGISLDDHQELWKELRTALAENEYVQQDKELKEFVARPEFAREGYWWFDPEEWI